MAPRVRLSELQYDLPGGLIAQRPVEPRDAARLLVVDRAGGSITHRTFREIGDYLRPGDRLVVNNTRVIPARFACRRRTGGRVEALFLRESDGIWRVLLKPTARLKIGERLVCEGAECELALRERHERGEWSVRPHPAVAPLDLLKRVGRTPLPPYIRRPGGPDAADAERYQTVYAQQAGAIAAPTAGLHFTHGLLQRLRDAGIEVSEVTLHVGVGTFAPIDVDDLAQHDMHAEWFEVAPAAIAEMHATRHAGRELIAVGTTSVRVLESLGFTLGGDDAGPQVARSGWTRLFIHPPYPFRNVDRLVTNFHLPGSTLLALVMAFAGVELTRRAYAAAIEQRYRFYSYGDAMLVL
jgi:S-adenosylmethionine:tRNA ribosyltransferase-isomerase